MDSQDTSRRVLPARHGHQKPYGARERVQHLAPRQDRQGSISLRELGAEEPENRLAQRDHPDRGLFVGVGYAALGDGVSRGEQILDQLVGIGASFGWSFVLTGAIMLAIDKTIGLAADQQGEGMGLDLSEHGEAAFEL